MKPLKVKALNYVNLGLFHFKAIVLYYVSVTFTQENKYCVAHALDLYFLFI